jgi:hypothetical protein
VLRTRDRVVGIAPGATGWTVRGSTAGGVGWGWGGGKISETTRGSAEAPVQWVLGVFWWESGRDGKLNTYLQIEPRSKMSVALSVLLLYTLVA